MPNYKDHDWLLGRRFVTDFRVVSIGDDAERTVTLYMFGDSYQLSLDELQTIIERGLVVEWPPPPIGKETG